MGVTISYRKQVVKRNYSDDVIQALRLFEHGAGKTLYIVHRITTESFLVLDFEPDNNRVNLRGRYGEEFWTTLGEKEQKTYSPRWK